MISRCRGRQSLEELDRPLLQGLGQQRVVGVGQGADGQVPRLVPAELGLVEQDAHQLGDGHRRVGVVELDGDLVGRGAASRCRGGGTGRRCRPASRRRGSTPGRTGATGPGASSRRGRGRGVSDLGERPCRARRRRSRRRLNSPKSKTSGVAACPEPQGVDRPAAVADHRPVVGHAEQVRSAARRSTGSCPPCDSERAAERHLHRLARPGDLPRVGPAQPVVGLLDLGAVADLLAEDPVLVAQAVADRPGSASVASESMKQAASRPSPPLPRPASGSCLERARASPSRGSDRRSLVDERLDTEVR